VIVEEKDEEKSGILSAFFSEYWGRTILRIPTDKTREKSLTWSRIRRTFAYIGVIVSR